MRHCDQQKAIELRHEGKSIKEIEAILNCARSSVSRWVKDVALTTEQKEELARRNPAYNRLCKGADTNSKKWAVLREQYKANGFLVAKNMEPLHIAACMLYWAEGAKCQNQARIINSDPRIISLFIAFVRKYFGTSDDLMSIRLNCYTDIHTLEEIENYWLKETGLPRVCLRKGTLNYFSPYSKKKRKGKCEYGTCSLSIMKSTKVIQHIYGAVEFYCTSFSKHVE